jgi:hypothetical protein
MTIGSDRFHTLILLEVDRPGHLTSASVQSFRNIHPKLRDGTYLESLEQSSCFVCGTDIMLHFSLGCEWRSVSGQTARIYVVWLCGVSCSEAAFRLEALLSSISPLFPSRSPSSKFAPHMHSPHPRNTSSLLTPPLTHHRGNYP